MNIKNKISIRKNLLIVFSLFMFVCFNTATSNNLSIGVPTKAADSLIFTVSWDNSWRVSAGPSNWDAIWLFVKWQDCTGNRIWKHSQVVKAWVAGAVLKTEVPTDLTGVYLYRIADGQGNIAATNVSITIEPIAVGTYNYEVHGIEMVYIPRGSFQLGDAAQTDTRSDAFTNYTVVDSTAIPADGLGTNAKNGLIPTTFPRGQYSMYCMKYEISQEQYVNFLNCLTFDQQVTRCGGIASVNGGAGTFTVAYPVNSTYSGIVIDIPGTNNMIPAAYATNCTNDANYGNFNDCQTNAMERLSWADMAAYLDWACLRPMSEIEFEKICRGTLPRVANEYAWGDNNIAQVTLASVTNLSQYNQVSNLSSLGLCNYGRELGSPLAGPYRVGMLAKSTTVRNNAGTTYYGVADMSGNVTEICVGVGGGSTGAASLNTGGLIFDGRIGDGNLTATGDANVTNWPAIPATLNCGIAMRGGSYYSHSSAYTNATYYMSWMGNLRVSDRTYMYRAAGLSPFGVNTINNYSAGLDGRYQGTGGRGVRQILPYFTITY
ncbi:MAG: hypothetical protein A2X12_02240 [Bacteroidetes bacterium GWE2_29_8]|nr:MAG: hypothetical protein A2X12_02240 [Bacteroidetes bacterium GWE2_29_8]OFY19173.1 MAG: hypothetical protein A2X02_01650 [Bacteroidetes bacterium GWF2_29_10]